MKDLNIKSISITFNSSFIFSEYIERRLYKISKIKKPWNLVLHTSLLLKETLKMLWGLEDGDIMFS